MATNNKKQDTVGGSSITIHVGTDFGDDESPANAILRFRLDADTGVLSEAGSPITSLKGVNPGWLSRYATVDNGKKGDCFVYVAMEDDPGMLQAFLLAPDREKDGQTTLEPRGDPVSSVGRHPCYCQLDKTGRWLFAANYTEGSVSVVPVLEDGSLGAATDSKHHQGRLRDELKDRQEGPHAHCIIPHPTNRYVVACDLGLSKVIVYGFDSTRGCFWGAADDPRHLTLPPEAGCRHCCWDRSGETLFVVNELSYTLTVASFDVSTGYLREVASVYLLRASDEPDRSHHRGASDIAVHPNGRFLYVGCRSTSPGLIAILKIDGNGLACGASLVGHEPTRGDVPRNFKLMSRGGTTWLVVGNQDGKNVVSYAVDSDTGGLQFRSEISTAPYKACNIASRDALYA